MHSAATLLASSTACRQYNVGLSPCHVSEACCFEKAIGIVLGCNLFCRGAEVCEKARQRALEQRLVKNGQLIRQQATWEAWLQAIGEASQPPATGKHSSARSCR